MTEKNDQKRGEAKKKLQQRNILNVLKGLSSEVNIRRKQKVPNSNANK